MKTADPDTEPMVLDDGFVDAAMGYCLEVPCIWEGCDREVEWFGDQHGCIQGPCCDFHLRESLDLLSQLLFMHGYLRCIHCGGKFHALNLFVKARRI